MMHGAASAGAEELPHTSQGGVTPSENQFTQELDS